MTYPLDDADSVQRLALNVIAEQAAETQTLTRVIGQQDSDDSVRAGIQTAMRGIAAATLHRIAGQLPDATPAHREWLEEQADGLHLDVTEILTGAWGTPPDDPDGAPSEAPTVVTDPTAPDQVLVTIPDLRYLETDAGTWSAQIGLYRYHLLALRDEIDRFIPPSGAVAGALARELERSTHQAEESRRAVTRLATLIRDSQQLLDVVQEDGNGRWLWGEIEGALRQAETAVQPLGGALLPHQLRDEPERLDRRSLPVMPADDETAVRDRVAGGEGLSPELARALWQELERTRVERSAWMLEVQRAAAEEQRHERFEVAAGARMLQHMTAEVQRMADRMTPDQVASRRVAWEQALPGAAGSPSEYRMVEMRAAAWRAARPGLS
ncbi:hypothetical protein [Streptomyces xiamenensis]|uniref:hypothetical protein n=1 Tax=Streptomyces xiamenensis TaxID=408015 RepID=UPI0037D2BEE5